MCNNNGDCRKLAGGVMCPSFRVTGNERDVTRGRANTLRLAISGQLGPDALASRRDAGDDEALRLLQGLPARMPDRRRHGADEDRGAGRARRAARALAARPPGRLPAALCALRGALRRCSMRATRIPGAAVLSEALAGLQRAAHACRAGGATCLRCGHDASLPTTAPATRERRMRSREVVLFADTFNRYFEPENLTRRCAVLRAAATACISPTPAGRRGAPALLRAHFSRRSARVEEARREAERVLAALAPFVERGVPVVGLEPCCLLTLRDEFPAMLPGRRAPSRSPRTRSCSKSSWRAKRRPGGSFCRSSRSREARAAARPLPSEGIRRHGRDREQRCG